MAGGVAVIKAGAATEVELRAASTASGCRAERQGSRRRGIVAGGGVALIPAKAFADLDLEGEEAVGANIVRVALESR